MEPKVALEIFGYFGTGLVLTSFIMKDIKWLRLVNIAGSLISMTYALLSSAMPVAVLNGSLILINGVQLVREIINDRKNAHAVKTAEAGAYDIVDKKRED